MLIYISSILLATLTVKTINTVSNFFSVFINIKKALFTTLSNATRGILNVHHFGASKHQSYTIISILQHKKDEEGLFITRGSPKHHYPPPQRSLYTSLHTLSSNSNLSYSGNVAKKCTARNPPTRSVVKKLSSFPDFLS